MTQLQIAPLSVSSGQFVTTNMNANNDKSTFTPKIHYFAKRLIKEAVNMLTLILLAKSLHGSGNIFIVIGYICR